MDYRELPTGLEQRILENLSSAILLFDSDLRLKYINTAAEMLLAVSSRQLLGQYASELIHCPRGLVEETLRRSVVSGQPFTEREHRLTLQEGREIKVDCTVTPVHQDGGRNTTSGVDGEKKLEFLVEMRQVDRQLRISREENLRSRNEASRALVRGLAHEIKNPLGGLRGAAQLLEQELPDEALQEYTRIIIQEADRLRKLVDSMLGPNQLPKRETVYIHQVLERVCQLVQVEVGEDLRIQRDYDPSIHPMLGDTDQLIQAFLNILRNGARATGKHGVLGIKSRVQRQFTIGNQRHRLVIAVELSDNGPGIPETLQEKIFFPLVSGESEGMGVGLSISQALISRHRGLIEFHTKPGRTVFTVLLPLEQIDG